MSIPDNAIRKIDSGFFNDNEAFLATAQRTNPTSNNTADRIQAIDDRLKRIEMQLDLRQPDLEPERTHARCSFSGLILPAQFFPSPLGSDTAQSQFYNAYRSATDAERNVMAMPRTISQDDFDKHSPVFFANKAMGSRLVKEFLVYAARKKLGRTKVACYASQYAHAFKRG